MSGLKKKLAFLAHLAFSHSHYKNMTQECSKSDATTQDINIFLYSSSLCRFCCILASCGTYFIHVYTVRKRNANATQTNRLL